MLKDGSGLAKWFIAQTHHSLTKLWGKGAFLFEKGPHSA